MLSVTIINDILIYLRAHNTCLSEIILAGLRNPHFTTHAFTEDIARNVTDVLSALSRHKKTGDALDTWAHEHMKQQYHQSARRLAHKQNGWHFSALHATAEQFEEFRIEDMAKDFPTSNQGSGTLQATCYRAKMRTRSPRRVVAKASPR